jgi:hypothetical protein
MEGGVAQDVDRNVPRGAAGFADDTAPRDALVAVPRAPGASTQSETACGVDWVVAESLHAARVAAGKVQGRRTTRSDPVALAVPDAPAGGVALATGWVEPAYLEPDASWCAPDGEPASPLANGGAFGGKAASIAPAAARELADRLARPVRVVLAREDTVRLGPKRAPVAATARFGDGTVVVDGRVARGGEHAFADLPVAYGIDVESRWEPVDVVGPPVSDGLRAFGLAEQAVLVEGALTEAGVDRAAIATERAATVLLDTAVVAPSGACAGARVAIDPERGHLTGVEVRVAAGDPLDETVLRSYCMGAVHMALGWVLSESLAIDPVDGAPLDLTIRSFGVIRARDLPAVTIEIVDDDGPPLARASDAVFAAVAAATWNALTTAEGARPRAFPARETRTARTLRQAL